MSDPARLGLALLVWAAGVVACAGLSGEGRRPQPVKRAGALALSAALLAPASMLVARAMLAGFGVLAFGRSLDLARRPGGLSFAGRLWLMVALFDVREARRCAPGFDADEARWWVLHLSVFCLAWIAVFRLAPLLEGAGYWALRWGAGLVACYALVETVQSSLLLLYRRLGVELPRINDYPILSASLAEFWGKRWNRVVSGWLNDNLFFPLARRRKVALGICAAFAGSTALHFWFAWVPLNLAAGLSMASFFVVHGLGMLLERSLELDRWSRAAKLTWTGAWIVVPSPLFVEPALRMLAGFGP